MLPILLAAALVVPPSLATTSPTQGPAPGAAAEATAVFAGGCFWGVEGVFEHLRGVKSATAGYAGGTVASPSYEQVSSGSTGHAESVRVVFDPAQISYKQLLAVFFSVAHDPTERNRQGPDVGSQYRSIVFYANDEEKREAEAYVAELTAKKVYPRPIVTEIVPLRGFYQAEDYHQGYMQRHPHQPYIVFNDAPKLVQLERQFPDLYRKPAGT